MPSIVLEYIAWSVAPCLTNTAPPFSSNLINSLLDMEDGRHFRHTKEPRGFLMASKLALHLALYTILAPYPSETQ